jgi:hypothetical protein
MSHGRAFKVEPDIDERRAHLLVNIHPVPVGADPFTQQRLDRLQHEIEKPPSVDNRGRIGVAPDNDAAVDERRPCWRI